MPKTELKVGGALYGGWKKISIRRGMEQISGAFDLSVTERWPDQRAPRLIKPGDACQVLVDGAPVITGHVDDVDPAFDKESHGVTISGRDRTGDLVDCAAIWKTGQWSGRTLAQICADLAAPFGIEVVDTVKAATPFPTFAIEEGESAFETTERAARMRGVLLLSDGEGRLVIARAGTGRAGSALVQGVNILAGEGKFSQRERFSRYIVKGQSQGNDQRFGAAVAQQKGEAVDEAITRYRPLIVMAEDQGDGVSLRERAAWERNVRMGRGSRATITVQGWAHAGGLWQPNQLVRVTSALLDVDEDLVVAEVALTLDDRGTLAALSVCRADAFDVLAQKARKQKEKGGFFQ